MKRATDLVIALGATCAVLLWWLAASRKADAAQVDADRARQALDAMGKMAYDATGEPHIIPYTQPLPAGWSETPPGGWGSV